MADQSVFCIQCGTKGNGKFCIKCGGELCQPEVETHIEKLVVSQPSTSDIDPMNQPLPVIQPLEQPHRSGVGKGCLISFLLLIGFFLLGGIVASLFFRTIFQNLTDGMLGYLLMNPGDFV